MAVFVNDAERTGSIEVERVVHLFHVNGVQARHHEIQREKDLGVPDDVLLNRDGLLARLLLGFELERRTRNVVLGEFAGVLDALDPQEHSAERHRCDEKAHQRAAPAELRRMDRECHREAAGDEYRRVDGAQPDVERMAGRRKRVRVRPAVDQIYEEQTTEEEHFGDEKQPHAERRGFVVLPEIVEVMRERRRMVRDGLRQHDPPPATDIRTRSM